MGKFTLDVNYYKKVIHKK